MSRPSSYECVPMLYVTRVDHGLYEARDERTTIRQTDDGWHIEVDGRHVGTAATLTDARMTAHDLQVTA